ASNGGATNDKITNDTTPTITSSGVPGNLVTLYDGSTVIATGTVGSNAFFSITPTDPLSDGNHTITATQTNPNTGATSDPSLALVVTIDTTRPPPPSNMALDPLFDSDTKGDGITNVTTPRITGTGVAGDTVTLKEGSTVLASGTVGSNGK